MSDKNVIAFVSFSIQSYNSNDGKNHQGLTKPRPKAFIKKVDCQDSIKGMICGVCIFLIAVVDICLFFGFNYHTKSKVRKNYKTIKIYININVDMMML